MENLLQNKYYFEELPNWLGITSDQIKWLMEVDLTYALLGLPGFFDALITVLSRDQLKEPVKSLSLLTVGVKDEPA